MYFQLPELGEGVYEAELVTWQVKPGDIVKRGQTLMEVLTDKATMEVPAPFAGTIQKLSAEPGQPLKIGDIVLTYETKEREPEPEKQPVRKPAKVATAAEAEEAPEESEKPRERKPVKAVPSEAEDEEPEKPRERKAVKPVPTEAEEEQPEEPRERKAIKPTPVLAKNGPSVAAGAPVRAAPSVRLMARKLGIDISHISGSGPDGRILIEDLSRQISLPDGGRRVRAEAPRADYGKPGQRIKFVGIRRKIAEHLVRSEHTIPHYSYVDECDVSELVRLREGLREPFRRAGVKFTYLPFVIKAAVEALQEVPLVNASLDEQAGEIILHDRYHVGIAVATANGLIVPVVHDADKKGLRQIAHELERLSDEARTGKSKREDLMGGTFTITNTGNIGGLFATPIIHLPQVAILGIGKIVKRPVFDAAGQVRSADMVYLSFSFDHRVVDGAVGAVFGNAVKKRLENPVEMLIPA